MNDVAIISLYCDLMEEVKARYVVIAAACTGKLSAFIPPAATAELCFLQLRMICELIALGALVAHGDIPATRTKKITKHYEADWILKTLGKIHPEFYPRPSRQILDDSAKVESIEPITSGYLSQKELAKLYHLCGEFLHRGTIEDIRSKRSRPVDFKLISDWAGKISTLLNHHQISLINKSREYWIVMQAKEDGKVHWAIMEEVKKPP